MSNISELTADCVRKDMRSTIAKAQLDKAKIEVTNRREDVSTALRGAIRAPGRISHVGQIAGGEQFSSAERALRKASADLKSQRKTTNLINKSHQEAYDRLKAAKHEGGIGPQPTSPLEYCFAETVPPLDLAVKRSASIRRSGSKRYRFESTLEGWRRQVDEAFADYTKIEAFPCPPGRCKGQGCPTKVTGSLCHCRIVEAFSEVEDFEEEIKRWSPKRFAACPTGKRKELQAMASKVCEVLEEMVAEQKASQQVPMAAPPKSRFGLRFKWW